MNTSASPLNRLWEGLFDTNQSRWRYLVGAMLLNLPVTLALALIVNQFLPFPASIKPPDRPGWVQVLLNIGFFPAIETVVMIAVFGLLRWFTKRTGLLIFLSALIWAALHAAGHLGWGIVIFWPFYLFSACYLGWEKKSRLQAWLMTAALHSLHNLLTPLLLSLMMHRP